MKTPEDRAANIKAQTNRVKRKYKVNVSTRRKFNFEGEEELVKDMVIVLKLANYTHNQIGSIVGISRGQVGEFLADTKVQKKYMKLKEALPQAALELGQAYIIEAVQTIVHVMRTEEDNAIVLKAASDLLDRFGIPKLSRLERKTEDGSPLGSIGRGGHEAIFEQVRGMAPEIQEKIANLYDSFEQGVQQIVSDGQETNSEINDPDH
jgi:hypothetical protein